MYRITLSTIVLALLALPLAAQEANEIAQAQQVLSLADSAGAQLYAKSLYDDAAYRIRFAQENITSPKAGVREQARMRAREAVFAARAALAKARWLSTNAAIRNLQADINRFGGHSAAVLQEESPNMMYARGATTKERIAAAQAAIDQARSAGAEQLVPDNDLKTAQDTLSSAKKVSLNGRENSDVADHLAYVAEMIARRAYYLAQFAASSRIVPDLQLQRTKLAQTSSEQSAVAERTQREEAERRTAELQRQLAAEEANRQAQSSELERLRQQVEENRRTMAQRIESDRQARIAAEKRLDDAMSKYEAAAASGSAPDLDAARRQVEDAEITLRTLQDRERLNQQAIDAEVAALRTDVQNAQNQNANAELIAQRQSDIIRRQADLDAYRNELQDDATRRADIQRRHEQAIADAQRQRQEVEAQAMRQQIELMQQAARSAQQQAQSTQQELQQAQQQAQTTQQQLQQAQQQAQTTQEQLQQAQKTQEQLKQQAQQSATEAEKARQAAAAAQAELDRARMQLAQREEEARQLKMQQDLARIAATKADTRGIVVTLPGIFFDPGKTQLKPGAKKPLQRIAEQLRGDDRIRVTVEGHTDNTGTPEKNMDISEKRAEAVREYLVSLGVPADRTMATGKGEAEPVATNKTAAGRQQNRRVELVITRT
jgi:outer membrane protein OmpA-like peptidoglycan-associated protein